MASTADPRLDLVSVTTLALTAWMGADMAQAVGHYIVIVACGLVGGGYALSRWRRCTVGEGALYLLGMTMLAMLLTVPAAELAMWVWPGLERRWLIAPAAVLIAGIGHDWPAVLGQAGSRALTLLQRPSTTITDREK